MTAARGSASDAVFANDLARFNVMLNDLDAVVTFPDGFVGIDPTKAPAELLEAYCHLVSYGYANGLLT